MSRITANGSGLREVTLPGAAHPATNPGSLARSCPGGQDGYGAIFANHGEPKKLIKTVIPVEPPC
jgi:hypothetical protein